MNFPTAILKGLAHLTAGSFYNKAMKDRLKGSGASRCMMSTTQQVSGMLLIAEGLGMQLCNML